jgi:hypothetical protein
VRRDSVLRVLFRRELRFSEGPDRLWLPTQEGLIAELRGEVRPGGSVTVFVRWLACVPRWLRNQLAVYRQRVLYPGEPSRVESCVFRVPAIVKGVQALSPITAFGGDGAQYV